MRLWALPCGGERVPASLLDASIDPVGAGVDPSGHDPKGGVYLPYFLYVIETPSALVLFDCGAHSDFARPDSVRHRSAGSSQVSVGADDNVEAALRLLGRSVAEVDIVVVSHLHYDHCGGLGRLPSADIYAAGSELEFAADPGPQQRDAYSKEDFASLPEDRWKLTDGLHDLLGDGSLVIVPTPGHTPGHISLLVRLPHHTLVLAGDAAYDMAAIRRRRLPGYLWDAEATVSSWETLEQLERSEAAEIVLTHQVQPGARVGPADYYD